MPPSLKFLVVGLALLQTNDFTWSHGGVVRGDRSEPVLALVFSGDEYGDGTAYIREVLARQNVEGTFFFTGRFYRNPRFADDIRRLEADGHYLGAHSDRHLLYCSWEDRDSLLVTRDELLRDILDNYAEMARFGVTKGEARFFMPPYEWYNEKIAVWTEELGLRLVSYSPGTRSHADYTTPDLDHYVSSDAIMESILSYEAEEPDGLNGFILLSHVGSAPERADKFYLRLEELISVLKLRGYGFQRIDELLKNADLSPGGEP